MDIKRIKIKDLEFVETSMACPEQYDVFDITGKLVGYVRLRWGELRCDFPNVHGSMIYHYSFEHEDGSLKGWFSNDDERMEYLTNIADKINEKIKSTYKLEVGVKVYKKSTDRNLIISHQAECGLWICIDPNISMNDKRFGVYQVPEEDLYIGWKNYESDCNK